MMNTLESRYTCISDYLFVNMLNTINGEKGQDEVTDLLDEEGGLTNWLSMMKDKGILAPKQFEKTNESAINVSSIQAFRDQCRRYLSDPKLKSDMTSLLASHTAHTPLYFDETLMPEPAEGGTDGLLSLLSYDMLKAYYDGTLRKLKKCQAPSCFALFIDPTGKRKWCSMKICGNRTKARKHYAKRQKQTHSSD